MKKVFCIGELLIDFVAENQGSKLESASQFTKKAGGAPANVAAAVARVGGKAGFIGAVGQDPFGEFLLNTLTEEKVDVRHAQRVQTFTTLAFVSLDKSGERDFIFSRGADRELKYDSEMVSVFGGQILHFGAATGFLGGHLEASYKQYLKEARASGCLVSFDPNYRADLWKEGITHFKDSCYNFLKSAHFAKLSLEEAEIITQADTPAAACQLLHELGVVCVAITLGARGTYLSVANQGEVIPSVPVECRDTTGAGDAFVGCMLWQLSAAGDPMAVIADFERMKEVTVLANRAGAYTTTSFGAIAALPKASDLVAV
ncbi:carbohydrate kinase family protein [Robertkochia flava]|uniref:carbohydrate kinase family protein n=1 Tax=Robertkochia flava TaxID=3447986 RepID=UPI001CCBC12A|nr:carbohydrate kinase [Robertkochia marina]